MASGSLPATHLACSGAAAHGDDRGRLAALTRLGKALNLPLVASGGVQMHVRERRALQDLLTAIRLNSADSRSGLWIAAEWRAALALMHRAGALSIRARVTRGNRSVLPSAARFSLDELRYEYPQELVPAWARTLQDGCASCTEEGARRRAGRRECRSTCGLSIEHELTLIAELRYGAYFLTVHDLVQFAARRKILCQGRGSAANSTVCYCLGVTPVDPGRQDVLFERFISAGAQRAARHRHRLRARAARRSHPVHRTRKYGRHRAAIARHAHHLSATQRAARCRQGNGPGPAAGRATGTCNALVGWQPGSRRARAQRGLRSSQSIACEAAWRECTKLIGFPRHLSAACGRLRDLTWARSKSWCRSRMPRCLIAP